jgi:hypothetical protein
MNEDLLDIGDEVLCVDSSIKPELRASIMKDYPVWIKEGDKYIIRDILRNDDIVVGILLEGRKNPPLWIPLIKRMQEPAFATWRFVKERTAYQIREEEKEKENDLALEEVMEDLENGKHV